MEKTGCKIICGAPTTLAVKRLMMMMMNLARPEVVAVFNLARPEVVVVFNLVRRA